MIRKHYDKILLVSALIVLLVVFAMAAFQPDPEPITAFVDIPALRGENTFTVSEVPDLDLSLPQLEEPPSQSAGPQWVFDVFTPPVILYDPVDNQFVLRGVERAAPTPFGIELVNVEEALYRVQLIASFGGDENPLVTLENLDTREQILARKGQEYANLAVEVRDVRRERVEIDHGGETVVTENVTFVVIYDQRLDQEVTLRSDRKRRDAEPTAEFRAADDPSQRFSSRVGESFTYNGATYRVDTISSDSAVVTRTGGDDDQETETTTLRVISGSETTAPGGQNSIPPAPEAHFR